MVNDLTKETYFTNLPEGIDAQIAQAIANRDYFALRREKSIVVFCIVDLKSYWFNYAGNKASYDYPNEKAFIDAVRIQLITHREFVSRQQLLDIIDKKLLT